MISKQYIRSLLLLVPLLAVVADSAPAQDPAAAVAAEPAAVATEYDGAAALGLALRRLGRTERVLMIGAHPDDENTALLSTLALGRGAHVAYLSLTRGEGGQNLIGGELQEALGLLRSEELLAARRLDGARQFFTRAIDYGYSKHADEAFRHWPRDSLLADVVRVVRVFRPDVIVSVFSGTERDGHGQHQAAGIMAREAFEAAGDPDRFAGQLEQGLEPHRPAKLYQSLWYEDEQGVRLPTGELDPLFGRSHYQIAMAARSRHRSQDMGRAQPPGPRSTSLQLVATAAPGDGYAYSGDSGSDGSGAAPIFAGVDTSLTARARTAAGAAGADALREALRDYETLASRLRDRLNALEPGALASDLARALELLRTADSLAAGNARLRFHIEAEAQDVRSALARAAGVKLDAVADAERVVPGQTFELELTLWNGGARPIGLASLAPALPAGWRATALDSLPAGGTLAPGALASRRFRVRVPDGDAATAGRTAEPTEPYFLRRSRSGDMYGWSGDPEVDGRPFEPDPVRADARVEVDGVPLELRRPATYRWVEEARGERRSPVFVVPAVSVRLTPGTAVLPMRDGGSARTLDFAVELTSAAPRAISGTLRLELPSGWSAEPAEVPVRFEPGDAGRTVEFAVSPGPAPAGEHAVRAVFETDDGRSYARGYTMVDYEHIRPRALYTGARARVSAFEVAVPEGLRVGYVMGAGDEVPDALRQLGVDIELLDAAALASSRLDGYDVIVTGIRAYEVREDLVARNERLFDYVRNGGTLIVQYNKYAFDEGDYDPFGLTMARPHDRVTDETAPVELLEPEHPVFTWPNRIGPADFEGWIQERGLYFAHSWDERYSPLFAMSDPGEEPLRGGMLLADMGEGTYVYTGLAFFRQLPAGVPGAYRLFANLLGLGAGD